MGYLYENCLDESQADKQPKVLDKIDANANGSLCIQTNKENCSSTDPVREKSHQQSSCHESSKEDVFGQSNKRFLLTNKFPL